jgi:hypothetical protein
MLDVRSELAIPPETGLLTLAYKLNREGLPVHARFFDAIINFYDILRWM